MRERFIFIALWLAAAPAFGQDIRPTSGETPSLRPIARIEGRKILATISTVDVQSESETDCSHLVHDVYQRAGFPYDYVSSRELYVGSRHFTRVHAPQAGDLVVWRGHVGIVIDPKQRSFFSFVRSGPDTQFYDSPYWRSRGIARFFRYVTEKGFRADRTLEAAGHADHQPLKGGSRASENRPPSRLSKPTLEGASDTAPIVDTSSPTTVEPARKIVIQVAGKNPSPEEVITAFAEMNRDSGESLRTRSLNSPGQSIVIYSELRASAVQIKGKRGTALVRIESLGALADPQTDSQPDWIEQLLELEKTKSGWVINPVRDTAYVKREVALKELSARLAGLSQNTEMTPEQKREQRQIIRLLNSLVADDSRTASAQTN